MCCNNVNHCYNTTQCRCVISVMTVTDMVISTVENYPDVWVKTGLNSDESARIFSNTSIMDSGMAVHPSGPIFKS